MTKYKKVFDESQMDILYLILDVMYNTGKLNFWYDKILRVQYSSLRYSFYLVLADLEKHKYKVIELTDKEIIDTIINYDL